MAQSKRYPPEPPDTDRDAEAHSTVWESALDPERKPYGNLVHDAMDLVHQGGTTNLAAAIEKLDRAIEKLPDDASAYAIRGEAHLVLAGWARCADDLRAALDHAPK